MFVPHECKKRTWFLSVLTHLYIFKVDPGVALSGTTHIFSQHGTGCMSCRRDASDVELLNPTLRLFDILASVLLLRRAQRDRRK